MSERMARLNVSRSGARFARRAATSLLVLLTAAGSGLAQKNPYLNYTEEKFVQNMQTAGRNYAAVAEMLAKKDYESAKPQLTRAREQLAITITFWRDKKKDDAVRLLREALNRTDDLDAALSQEVLNPSTIETASQKLNAACQACHAVYRTKDPVTQAYRLNVETVQ
jgi:hypothetical protein